LTCHDVLHALYFYLHISPLFPYPSLFRSKRHRFYLGRSHFGSKSIVKVSAPYLKLTPSPRGRAGRGGGQSPARPARPRGLGVSLDRKSTRLNSSHVAISYAVFCLKKKSNE